MTHGAEQGPGLVLVGYRGTGKTSIGRRVAERLGRRFADADEALERKSGRSVAAIFAEEGEPAFRDLEEGIIAELSAVPGLVLATGGGAILRESNRAALRRLGPVVWLTADPDEIARRLSSDRRQVAVRPALTSLGTVGEIRAVLEARLPHYREAADAVLETSGRGPRELADELAGRWGELAKLWEGRRD